MVMWPMAMNLYRFLTGDTIEIDCLIIKANLL